jgi:hypothetical protein
MKNHEREIFEDVNRTFTKNSQINTEYNKQKLYNVLLLLTTFFGKKIEYI